MRFESGREWDGSMMGWSGSLLGLGEITWVNRAWGGICSLVGVTALRFGSQEGALPSMHCPYCVDGFGVYA